MIRNDEIQKLIGELPFAQSMVFGKCARALLRPLYSWLYSGHFDARITPQIAEIFCWWVRLLRSLQPMICPIRPRYPDFIIFTDAPYKQGAVEIAAFLFHRETFLDTGNVLHVAQDTVPANILEYFADTLPIFALEFFVIISAVFQWRHILQGESITLFTDSTAAFGAILNAGSDSHSVSAPSLRFWFLIDQFSIFLWMERVLLMCKMFNGRNTSKKQKFNLLLFILVIAEKYFA